MQEVSESDLKFRLPSAIFIGGSTMSGKTSFVLKLLSCYEQMFDPIPKKILYCYGIFGEHIKTINEMGIETFSGIPDDDFLMKFQRPLLIVLDDMLGNVNQKWMNDLFTKKVHHTQTSVIFLTQHLFDKKLQVARINSQYLILSRAPNSLNSIRTIGSHLFPNKMNDFIAAYDEATSKPFGYILIDLHPLTDYKLKLRTKIFPDEIGQVFMCD